MKNKPIIIVAGEPNSIFFEIFLKSIKFKKYKSPLILICSKNDFQRQMEKLKVNVALQKIRRTLIVACREARQIVFQKAKELPPLVRKKEREQGAKQLYQTLKQQKSEKWKTAVLRCQQQRQNGRTGARFLRGQQ